MYIGSELKEKYPEFFEARADIWFPIGWSKLVENMLVGMKDYNNYNPSFKVPKIFQIKEKFGELRIYSNYSDQPYRGFIRQAEKASSEICQVTGMPGRQRNINGWIFTLCDEEYNKRKPDYEEIETEESETDRSI